jgi:hypothetical protein
MLVRILTAMAVLLLYQVAIRADEKPAPASDAAAKQYKALVDEFEDDGEAREFAGRFVEFAKQHPKDSVAADSLVWVVVKVSRGRELQEALTLLAQKYQKSDRLAPACRKLAFRPSLAAEKLLRVLREKSPHKEVRAPATFYLAVYLQRQLRLAEALSKEEDKNRFVQFYGKEFTTHLAEFDTSASLKEIESIYDEVKKSFAGFKVGDSTMGETSQLELFAIRHLSLGREAPEITGEDVDRKKFKLSDYRGKVVMLDFWGHW